MSNNKINLIKLLLESDISEDKYNQISKILAPKSNIDRVKELANKYDSELVFKYPMLYKYANQTKEFAKRLLSSNPEALRYINKDLLSVELLKTAVSKDGLVYRHIPKDLLPISRTIETIAIKNNPYAIQYTEQTPENNKLAVSRSGFVIQYINKQTPELAMAAVKQNGGALQFVDKSLQTPELIAAALESNTEALQWVLPKFQTPELCGKYIKKYPNLIRYIKDITPEMILSIIPEEHLL